MCETLCVACFGASPRGAKAVPAVNTGPRDEVTHTLTHQRTHVMSYTSQQSEVVLITGASAGIGRATAHEFAKRGANVALLARNIDGLNGAKREVEALGGHAITCICDVSDPAQIERAATETEAAFGPIDVWVNNAMVSFLAPLKEVTPEEFRRVTDVTYHGQVYGTMEALKRMRPRNAGSIVLVGSALAYRGIPLQTAYCGAKHAIQGFYDSLRAELIHEGSDIRVSMVQLPGVNTTQFKLTRNKMPNKPRPMGAVYEPEVAARGIVYAADSGEREVFVGAPTFQTIWGNKLFPGFADRVLGHTGVSGQLTDEPADPQARDYLFEPVPGDHGYKGGFQAQARDVSPLLWVTMHKWFGAALVGGLAAAGAALLLRGGSSGGGGRARQAATPQGSSDEAWRQHGGAAAAQSEAPSQPMAYPDRNLSGIHGGAPDEFAYAQADDPAYTQAGDVNLYDARHRQGSVVLDGVD